MKLVWLTDIHINFLNERDRTTFYLEITKSDSQAVLITGDIAEATNVHSLLNEMVSYIKIPVYFVLGNHDYYRGEVEKVRESMSLLMKEHDLLFWLPAAGPQVFNNTVLIGQDGWADGRLGDYQQSTVSLNDSLMIMDLFESKKLGKSQLLEKMQQLAELDAKQLEKDLVESYKYHPQKIIVLTHIPPFKEACQHQGKMSDDNWLPYFSSKIMGDVLIRAAKENPSINFLVLCGHTHSEALFQPVDNLIVKAGKAQYYRPEIQEIITA